MSLHLEREITALQASFTMDSTDEAEAAAAAAVGAFDMKLAEEFGERRARVYSRVVKSQIAGVRQAERLEIARGMVAARNAARDERIQAIRQARIAEDSARAKASREIRRAAKDDLAYRQMYQAALASAQVSERPGGEGAGLLAGAEVHPVVGLLRRVDLPVERSVPGWNLGGWHWSSEARQKEEP